MSASAAVFVFLIERNVAATNFGIIFRNIGSHAMVGRLRSHDNIYAVDVTSFSLSVFLYLVRRSIIHSIAFGHKRAGERAN